MFYGFKWCVPVLIIQFVLSPIAADAAATTQLGAPLSSSKESTNPVSPKAPANPVLPLQVAIRAGREIVTPGESVSYELTVTNTSKQQGARDVRLMDLLPEGFRLIKRSVRLGGGTAPEPVISPDGRALTFVVGNLEPGASSIIRFEAETTAGPVPDNGVSVASAFSADGASNIAKAAVTFRAAPQPSLAAANVLPPILAPVVIPLPALPEKGSGVTVPVADTGAVAVKAATSDVQTTPASLAPPLPAPPQAPATADTVTTFPAAPAAVPPAAPSADASPGPVPVKVPTADVTPSPAVATAVQSAAPVPDSPSQEVPDEEEKLPNDDPVTEDFVVQKSQTLAELVGRVDISVLSDVDGQFVKNMAENQTMENEFARQVDETTLLESIRVGRSFNRESRAALARSEQANAQTGQAFALLLPSLSVRANYGLEASNPSVKTVDNKPVADTHSRTDASLTVRQPLFDLPSFMDWQRRKVVEQARGENYRVSDGEAYIAAVNAYLSIVSSRLQTEMTREFETKLNDLLIYVEKRAKAGAASNSDMARVRARSQATLSSRLEQESAHAAAGIEFIRLTNLVPRTVRLPALEDIGASFLPKSLDMAVTTAMKSNPDIAALNAEIEAAEFDKKVAKSRYLPKVDAEYTNSYTLHAGGNPSAAGQKDQRLMMVLNWNLYSGGSDFKNNVERAARHKELQYRLDDQRRRVVQTLSANYATFSTTRERISSGYQELKSISTAADAMSKRMLSGNQSLLDMLDVYDRLYQVRSRLVSLHVLEMSTAAQLVRLMRGTPGVLAEAKAASDNGLPK